MLQTPTVEKPAVQAAKKKIEGKIEEVRETPVMERMEQYSPPVFMGLTLASIIYSVVLFLRKSRENAIFVGLWAPTFLTLGLFYTLVGWWKKK